MMPRLGGRVARAIVWVVFGVALLKAAANYFGAASLFPVLFAASLVVAVGGTWRRPDWCWVVPAVLVGMALLSFVAPYMQQPVGDGLFYHKPAIVALHDGWNPWRNPNVLDWMATRVEPYYSPAIWEGALHAVWVSHFANGSWLFGSGWMDLGFHWESTKILSWALLAAMFLYAREVLEQYVPSRRFRNGCCILLALCPTALGQLASDYVDGAIYAVFLLSLFAILDRERGPNVDALAAASLLLLASFKLTGILYAGLLAITYLAVKRPPFVRIAPWIAAGLLFLSHPYLNNVRRGLSPAYPLAPRVYDIFDGMAPEYLEAPRPLSFLRSLGASSSNLTAASGWKVPGTVTIYEADVAGFLDTRQGGFGPLFSLALILSLGAALLAVSRKGTREGAAWPRQRALLLGAALLLAVAVIHEAPWWARFIPFFYAFPILLIAVGANGHRRAARAVALAAMVCLAANGLLAVRSAGACLAKRGLKTGLRVDRHLAAALPRDESLVVTSPPWMGLAGVYHLVHDLGFRDVRYARPEDLDACTESESAAVWLNQVQVCSRSAR